MRAFDKPAIIVTQQLQLLKDRGLAIQDDERTSRFLEVVSLFRLSPYMRPFQPGGNPDHPFLPGTSLRQIVTFNLPQEVLGSWLHTLTFIRNICAHHARLWNRELAVRPQLPQQSNWQLPRAASPQPHPDKRLFVVLLMLAYMMGQISPDSHWKQQMAALLAEYPNINLPDMGFVANWQQHPVWQGIEE